MTEYRSHPFEDKNYFCRIEEIEAEEINDLFDLNKDKEGDGILLKAKDMEE